MITISKSDEISKSTNDQLEIYIFKVRLKNPQITSSQFTMKILTSVFYLTFVNYLLRQ